MSWSDSPRVGVLMAVYNGANYLDAAIDSILGQSFGDIDLLVVDDGSSDATPRLLAARTDARLRVLRNPVNIGLTRSLNIGLAALNTPYVARMDADDIAHPERLALQVAVLDEHPDHVLVGSSYRVIDAVGRVVQTVRKPAADLELRWVSQLRTAVEHSSATFRRCAPDGTPYAYDERWRTAQDAALWLRLLRDGKGRVLAPPLLDYRVHDRAVTACRRAEQRATLMRIACENAVARYRFDPPQMRDFEDLCALYLMEDTVDEARFEGAVRGLGHLTAAFAVHEALGPKDIRFVRRRGAGQLWSAAGRAWWAGRTGFLGPLRLIWTGRSTLPDLAGRLASRGAAVMTGREDVR